ncbi:S-layer homology domain-containing protein [Paenibacillus sp. N3.4]|uniref:S-layer homology domain-containing protein n=1 Tax=Paenibacillus sp. N3.4 TaxID=2603222 RepID=UPI00164F5357|nr:S-layer homology domain-containing protein [Paenibacillus sp. N3.4]
MKRIVVSIFAAVLIVSMCAGKGFAASVSLSVSAAIDADTKEVTLAGTTSKGKGQRIFVEVIDSDQVLEYLNQLVSGDGGMFAESFRMNSASPSKTYTVKVYSEQPDSSASTQFQYHGSANPGSDPSTGQGNGTNLDSDTASGTTPGAASSRLVKDIDALLGSMYALSITPELALAGAKELIRSARSGSPNIAEPAKQEVTHKLTQLAEEVMAQFATMQATSLHKVETGTQIRVTIDALTAIANLNRWIAVRAELSELLAQSGLDVHLPSKAEGIVIDVGQTAKKDVQTSLPARVVQQAASQAVGIVIRTDSIDIQFPSAAFDTAMVKKAVAENAAISVAYKKFRQEALTDIQGAAGDTGGSMKAVADAFDFQVLKTRGEATETIESFTDKVTISIHESNFSANPYNAEKWGIYRYEPERKTWVYVGGKLDKKTQSLNFQTSHFSLYAILEWNKTFRDIASHWAKSDIEVMTSRHVVQGIEEQLFLPEASVTRAQFTAFMTRALRLDEKSYTDGFSDVTADKWYAGLVQAAFDHQLIQGSENRFEPEANMSREQMAVFLARVYTQSGGTAITAGENVSFKDETSISPWALEAVRTVSRLGILQGRSGGEYAPKESVTRAEAAAVIRRLMDLI